MSNLFREKLFESDDFILTYELVSGRSSKGKGVWKALSFARQAAVDGLLDALSITDNAGGNPSLSPDVLGKEIKQLGIEPIVHFACRDWNRYGAFSRALQLDRLGIENLLVVTGDYPTEGPAGTAEPCFDLDSVTMMCMLDRMNKGQQTFCSEGNVNKAERTDFLIGGAVSCFKYAESEVVNQYYKLFKKIRNGSSFLISQICYDARKFDELLRFLSGNKLDVPVLGSVYILNSAAARYMAAGNVPGAYIPAKLLEQVVSESASDDKGRKASLMRTAKLVAILKGLGYRGAHLSGAARYDDIRDIILNFQKLQNDWREFVCEFDFGYPGGFYLYEKDEVSGLNRTARARSKRRSVVAFVSYGIMSIFHYLFFDKNAPQYRLIRGVARIIDKVGVFRVMFGLAEDIIKLIMFGCKKCGDCALADMVYLCPESKCPKHLRNGPCGGSEKTRCKIKKNKQCVWCRVYERLKSHHKESELTGRCVPPRNWALDDTSSWLNFYLERDYHSDAVIYCDRLDGTGQQPGETP